MTDDMILDTILFQTVVLHQPYETQLSPSLIRELMGRFAHWVNTIMGHFSGAGGPEKYEIPKEWTDPWEVKKK